MVNSIHVKRKRNIFIFVLNHERSSDQTEADQTASLVYEWIVDHGVKESLLAIGGDSTNVNTGCWGGAIQFLEKNRKEAYLAHLCFAYK